MMILLERPEWRLAVALLIGLLIGAERERRKGEGPGRGSAGIRTFALVALLGAIAAQMQMPVLTVLAGSFVVLLTVTGYVMTRGSDPGMTSEVALAVTFFLGVFAQSQPAIALGVGVTVAVLLAFRERLHHLVRNTLSEQEISDALILALSALVILPLLPNAAIDPLGVFNPFTLWRLVVVMISLTALGHLAARLIGARYGLTFAGLASGFVSSAATIASMASKSKEDAGLERPTIAAASASTIATFVLLAVLVGAASPRLLLGLLPSIALGGGVILLYTMIQTYRTKPPQSNHADKHAFNLLSAVTFAALITVITFVVALAQRWLGNSAAILLAGLAGFADSHSPAASVAALESSKSLSLWSAQLAVLLILSTNTLTKLVLAWSLGSRGYARWLTLGLLLSLAAAWLGLVIKL